MAMRDGRLQRLRLGIVFFGCWLAVSSAMVTHVSPNVCGGGSCATNCYPEIPHIFVRRYGLQRGDFGDEIEAQCVHDNLPINGSTLAIANSYDDFDRYELLEPCTLITGFYYDCFLTKTFKAYYDDISPFQVKPNSDQNNFKPNPLEELNLACRKTLEDLLQRPGSYALISVADFRPRAEHPGLESAEVYGYRLVHEPNWLKLTGRKHNSVTLTVANLQFDVDFSFVEEYGFSNLSCYERFVELGDQTIPTICTARDLSIAVAGGSHCYPLSDTLILYGDVIDQLARDPNYKGEVNAGDDDEALRYEKEVSAGGAKKTAAAVAPLLAAVGSAVFVLVVGLV